MAGFNTGEWWRAVAEDGRDPRLGLFASGGELDGALPSARTLGLLECLAEPSGPQGRPFAGSTHDEDAGLLAALQTLEGHVASLKLAAVRQLIRRHAFASPASAPLTPPPLTSTSAPAPSSSSSSSSASPAAPAGGLPDPSLWDIGLMHEIAAVLRISWQSAYPLADLAWQLEARLPGVGKLLDTGVLSYLTAKIIAEEFSVLDADKATEAEKRLLEYDLAADDMTPGKIRRLCQRLADAADPAGAARRREQKQRDEARVVYYRAHGGAVSLLATGLPPDEALMSESNLQKRALEYKKAGIKEKMDRLRLLALADFTNGITVPARYALWLAEQENIESTGEDNPARRDWEAEQAANAARTRYGDRPPFPDEEPSDLDDPDFAGPDPSYPDPSAPEPGDPDPSKPPAAGGAGSGETGQDEPPFPGNPAADGSCEPGSRGGGGSTDEDDGTENGTDGPGPDGGSPDGDEPRDRSYDGGSDDDGDGGRDVDRAGDDGDGDDGGPGGPDGPRPGPGTGPVPAGVPDPGLPSRVNLTLPLTTVLGLADRPGEAPGLGSLDPVLVRSLADAAAASPRSEFCVTFTDENGHAAAHGCARLIRETGPPGGTRDGPPGTPTGNRWDFASDTSRPGPEGGHGNWILTLPSGARYRVAVHGIPLRECDHRYATGAYRPTALLRHLVEVRDGECTFPGCSHPARESDFEHAIPYHQGGETDACNAGMRSRRCHQVKQSPGWNVTQPAPGWHRWEAPSGRSYTKGPKEYPA